MKPTHTIRVMLDDGRVQRHYIEATREGGLEVTPDFNVFMYFCRGEWIGWRIENSFYLRENVTGIQIELFEGFVADINGYQVICDDPNDLPIAIRDHQVACANEIKALDDYLRGLGNVHPNEQYARSGSNPGDSRSEASDPQNS